MKKMRGVFIGLILVVLGTASYAQAPYTHSIGGIVGTFNGASYKTFALGEKLAFQADLGAGLAMTRGTSFWGFDINPNLMYEQQISNIGLYWFAGGGISLGVGSYGRFGINAIGGVEYKFNIPLTIQADVRPGFGLMFNSYSYFDWGLNISARYTF